MREPWEWEEADLEALVTNRVKEGPNLDFKECAALDNTDKKKRELSKDVSALANSAGGALVYGIIEDKKTHTAQGLDVGYDPAVVTKEWIEQVINSNVQPRISGIRIKPIELSSTDPGRVAYVVAVPQGSTAHQAADKRYYRRYNFESVPMEDYEIRDVMNRVTSPDLSVEVRIGEKIQGEFMLHSVGQNLNSPLLEVLLINGASAAAAERPQTHVFLPRQFKVPMTNAAFVPSRTQVTTSGGFMALQHGEWQMSEAPVFPGQRKALGSIQFTVPPDMSLSETGIPLLLWRVRELRSAPRMGMVWFRRVYSQTWQFLPLSIDELSERGCTVHFDD